MSLVLKRTPAQEAELDRLLQDQQNPQSPQFHTWLTPEAFGSRFGFSDADLTMLSKWLESSGLQVQEIAPSRNRIVFSGTASAVEDAFHITMGRYSRSGQTFYENSDPVQLPASLQGVVSGVTGLSSYKLTASGAVQKATGIQPQYYNSSSGARYLVPWDFRQIFDMNSLINAGSDGTGIKIGVIGQSAIDLTQVAYFQQKTGQGSRPPALVLVPNTGSSNLVQQDEDESELDVEYAGGSAPGASVQFIYTGCGASSSTSTLPATTDCQNDGVNTAIAYAITHNLAPILTFSYGACEASIAAYATSTLEPILKQANAQGQTILVSSGDTGAATCDQGTHATSATKGLTVSYPASSPYVTGVGGTQISDVGPVNWSTTNNSYGGSAPGYVPEVAWNDTAAYGSLSASGGGVSKIFTKPSWQVGSNVPQDGYRDVPDVAFPASVEHTPYLACTGSAACQSVSGFGGVPSGQTNGGLYGGTSLSAPNFAAMLAVIEQKNASGPLGNINPELYAIAQGSSAATVFHDIQTGDNKVPCVLGSTDCPGSVNGSIGYRADNGYDQVTGLGSVSASALATALASQSPAVQLSASSLTPVVDQPVTFTATILATSPTPTGTVTFSIDGTDISTAVPLSSNSASFTYSGFQKPAYTSAGAYPLVKATYSGDTNYGTSSSTLTVGAIQVPVSLQMSSSVSPLPTNTPTTFKITASGSYGTPTDYVLLMVDGGYVANGLSPLVLVNGVATYNYAGFKSAGLHTVTATYFTQADQANDIPTPIGYVRPYTAYEGGTVELDLQVTSSTQTQTPLVTVTKTPTGPLAPSDYAEIAFMVSGSGPAPTGGYSYSIDGGSYYIVPGGGNTGSSTTYSLTLGPPGGWTPGTHTVRFIYNGDNNYKPTSVVTTTFTVVAPAFTLSISPSTLTVASGGSGSVTLTVNAGVTYSGNTSFKLALLSATGDPFAGCYSLPSAPVFSSRGVPITTTLTMISGTAGCTSGSNISRPLSAQAGGGLTGKSLLFASIGIIGAFTVRRRSIWGRLMVALFAVSLLLTGCSGTGSSGVSTTSSGSGGGGGTTTKSTGTYVLQVTGTSGADTTLTQRATFTFIVQ